MVATLGALLLWSLRRGETTNSRVETEPAEALEIPGGHVVHLAQIQQALQENDLSFLALRGSHRLSRQVRRERRRVVLRYLSALRMDFERLLRLARVIAVLSPEVAPAQEWERLRLSLRFSMQCEMVRLELALGRTNLPQLSGVGRTVSGLSLRLELAMTELGERAALATELASALNR
jgi:hypothetical protein